MIINMKATDACKELKRLLKGLGVFHNLDYSGSFRRVIFAPPISKSRAVKLTRLIRIMRDEELL